MILDSLMNMKRKFLIKDFQPKKYKLVKNNEQYLLKINPNDKISTKLLEKKYNDQISLIPSCCNLLDINFDIENIKSDYNRIDEEDLLDCKKRF